MMLSVSTLMGVSATMFSMVGGFLLLRHTRITTRIEEAKHREGIYRVEEKAIGSKKPWFDWPDIDERRRVLINKIDEEGLLASRLSASRGRLWAIAFSWLAMLAIGIVAPVVATGFIGWTAPDYVLGIAHLAVVLAMVLAVWFALVPNKEDLIPDNGEAISIPSEDSIVSDQVSNYRM